MKLYITNGIIDKEGYERKMNYVHDRNEQSKESGIMNGLTEEQCDVLAQIASDRHFIHTHQDSFFNSESADNNTINQLLYGESENSIYQKLKSVGLDNHLLWNVSDIPCDIDVYELGEDYDTCYESCMDKLNDINNQIESYLKSIDDKYGTSYCPSGYGRLK